MQTWTHVEVISAAGAAAGVVIDLSNQDEAFTITGSSHNDTITGGGGDDTITGGLGADTIIIAMVGDFNAGETINGIFEQGTIDTLRLDDADGYTLTGVTNIDALVLSDDANGFDVTVANAMVSTADFNQDGTGGDLRISSDTVMTDDVTIDASGLTGGINRILVDGTNLGGDDTITGGAGADTIAGGGGDDEITGGLGADTLSGGNGGDTYLFAAGDVVFGESITDTGASGTDTISVSGTNDFTAATVSGIEALTFTAAATTTFNSNQLPANLAVTGSSGTNNIIINMSAAGTFSIAGWSFTSWTAGIDTITINGASGADTITGSARADIINSGAAADIINGGDGADIISGGAGSDTIIIAAANDFDSGETINGAAEQGTIDTLRLDDADGYTLTGVTNIDALVLSDDANGFDVTVANAMVSTADFNQDGTGGDLRISSDTVMTDDVTIDASGLTGGINRILVDGTNLGGDDTITGGAGADTIAGGGGDDTLAGGGGNDVITSGVGNDELVGGDDDDTFVLAGNLSSADTINGGAGTDTLTFTDTGAATTDLNDVANVEIITLGAATTSVITVNALVALGQTLTVNGSALTAAQTLTWNGAAETNGAFNITGGAGNDVITGGTGNDIVAGGAGSDTITGGGGADSLTGGTSNNSYRYASTAEAAVGENIVEAASGGTDTIITTANADLSALKVNGSTDLQGAGASEGIEQILIASGNTATFSGAQLTGNTIVINESANGNTNLIINVASGATNTFANLSFDAFAGGGNAFDNGTDTITINGAGAQ